MSWLSDAEGLCSGASRLDIFDHLDLSFPNDFVLEQQKGLSSEVLAEETKDRVFFNNKFTGGSNGAPREQSREQTLATAVTSEPKTNHCIKGSERLPLHSSSQANDSDAIRSTIVSQHHSSAQFMKPQQPAHVGATSPIAKHQKTIGASRIFPEQQPVSLSVPSKPIPLWNPHQHSLLAEPLISPGPTPEEVTRFEQLLKQSSCRRTTIIFSMEWLGVKVKSASLIKGVDDFMRLADNQSEGGSQSLEDCRVMLSTCNRTLHQLYSQAHTKMAVESDPAKKQLIELDSNEKVGLIRFHVSISRFRQAFNSLTNLAVRLCQKKGKSLYSEVMTVSRFNTLTLEQEVIFKIVNQLTGANQKDRNAITHVDEAELYASELEGYGPNSKVYKKNGHKDGKLVQSFEVAVEEKRNGFFNATTASKNGEKKTLLWEAQYPHAPGLDIVIYFLVIKEISPVLFWSMKREISSKQLNDIERYGQLIKIHLLPEDEKLQASNVFDFKTGRQIDEELIGAQVSTPTPVEQPIPPKNNLAVNTIAKAVDPKVELPSIMQTNQNSGTKLSSDPVDEILFHRRDMIMQNPFSLSQLQPRQIIILLEQVIDRNHSLRYLNLGETFRRADYFRQQIGVRAVINSCAKLTVYHLKKINGIEFKVLRIKLAKDHFSSRLYFDGKAITGLTTEVQTLEYPDYDGLIFSESIHLLHMVFREQLDNLNVKEYLGRLKASFDKPFVLTAPVPPPPSVPSLSKDAAQTKAPPPAAISATQVLNKPSLVIEQTQVQIPTKHSISSPMNSAGKTHLHLKHLQSGADMLQRLARVASVSRGNTSVDYHSASTSFGKATELRRSAGDVLEHPDKKNIHRDQKSGRHEGVSSGSAAREELKDDMESLYVSSLSSDERDGKQELLGKRKPAIQTQSDQKFLEFSTRIKRIELKGIQPSPSSMEQTLREESNLKKSKYLQALIKDEPDSAAQSKEPKPKRKIKITPDDLRTVQVITRLGYGHFKSPEVLSSQNKSNPVLSQQLLTDKTSLNSKPLRKEKSAEKVQRRVARKESKRIRKVSSSSHSSIHTAFGMVAEPQLISVRGKQLGPTLHTATPNINLPKPAKPSTPYRVSTPFPTQLKGAQEVESQQLKSARQNIGLPDLPPADFSSPEVTQTEESRRTTPIQSKFLIAPAKVKVSKKFSPLAKKTPHRPKPSRKVPPERSLKSSSPKSQASREMTADEDDSSDMDVEVSELPIPKSSFREGYKNPAVSEGSDLSEDHESRTAEQSRSTSNPSPGNPSTNSEVVIMIVDDDSTLGSKAQRANVELSEPVDFADRKKPKNISTKTRAESPPKFAERLVNLQRRIVDFHQKGRGVRSRQGDKEVPSARGREDSEESGPVSEPSGSLCVDSDESSNEERQVWRGRKYHEEEERRVVEMRKDGIPWKLDKRVMYGRQGEGLEKWAEVGRRSEKVSGCVRGRGTQDREYHGAETQRNTDSRGQWRGMGVQRHSRR